MFSSVISHAELMDWLLTGRAEGETCTRPWIDVSGVGVRAGIYIQAAIVFLCGAYCVYLSKQPPGRRHAWARKALKSTPWLVLGVEQHLYIVAHARLYGLATYDVSVHNSLTYLLGFTSLLIAVLNWLLLPLDNPDAANDIVANLTSTVTLFSTNLMASVLVGNTGSWSCLHYASDPRHGVTVKLDPLFLQASTFVFDVVLDHLMPLGNNYFGVFMFLPSILLWTENPGVRIPKTWRNLEAEPMRAVSKLLMKAFGSTLGALLSLCAWATQNTRRIGWSIVLSMSMCAVLIIGLICWTETVVTAIEKPRGVPREEQWRQGLAFGILILPAVRLIPHLWLLPYLKACVRESSHNTTIKQ